MITIPAENKQNMKEGKVDMDLTVLVFHEEIKSSSVSESRRRISLISPT